MKKWLEENQGFISAGILIFLFIILPISYGIFAEYVEIKAKWNIAHMQNCPCVAEVQK